MQSKAVELYLPVQSRGDVAVVIKSTPTRADAAEVYRAAPRKAEMFRFRLVLAIRWACGLALLLGALVTSQPSRADVGLVLNESLDTSVARITGSGHSAIYFSRICPETPVKLRLCRPDEQGSVMSNYTTLGEDQPFEWNIVPLSMYLYGVEDPRNRPLFATWKIKHLLEERYRDTTLSAYCASQSCRTSNKAEWREMVGATLERSMYIFAVSTTVEQDQALIAEFNAATNENHFNGMTNNCANFSRRVLNSYFPNAARPDYLNDFGMTSPKAVARSFAHYGERHPESHFYVLHFAQLPGTIKRSSEARSGTEQLYHSKKLLVPMVIFADHALPFVAATYVLTGRFNPETELEHNPSQLASDQNAQIREAKADKDEERTAELQAAVREESVELVGTSKEWKDYRNLYDSLADEAVHQEIVPDRDSLDHLFKQLDHNAVASIDPDGSLWLEFPQGGKTVRLGVSNNNIFAAGTDAQWAYAVTLARASSYIKSPKHSREIMPYFKNDWALLESARVKATTARSARVQAAALPAASAARVASLISTDAQAQSAVKTQTADANNKLQK
jgi:hypothetical protein